MARYIDADALIESIQETLCSKCDKYDGIKCKSCGIDDTLDFLDTAPTADVAPKSEAINEYLAKVLEKKDTASHYAPGAEVVTVDVLEHYARQFTEGSGESGGI